MDINLIEIILAIRRYILIDSSPVLLWNLYSLHILHYDVTTNLCLFRFTFNSHYKLSKNNHKFIYNCEVEKDGSCLASCRLSIWQFYYIGICVLILSKYLFRLINFSLWIETPTGSKYVNSLHVMDSSC